jgi:hypothetical protein
MTETCRSTTVDRKVKFIFADGAEVASNITSKTTFNARKSGRKGRNPYDAEAIANLVEAVGLAMAANAANDMERDISVE